ncbi:family 16 glycoside hydrolase [bacterium]
MKNKIIFLLTVCILATSLVANECKTKSCYDQVRIKKIPIAMQCWTFRKFSFIETLDKVKDLDVHYIEAYSGQKLVPDEQDESHFGPELTNEQMKWVKEELKKRDLHLISFGVVNFDPTEEATEKVFKFSKEMGIQTVVTEPLYEDFSHIEKMVKKYDLKVAIHNHPTPSKYWDPQTVVEHYRGLDPRIGGGADTGHWMRSGVCPIAALKLMKGRIRNVHLKDLNEFGNRDAYDVPFGQGKANIKAILAELTLQDYDGYIVVEHEKKEDEMNPSPPIAEGIKYIKSITYYQDYTQILKREKGKYNKHGWNQYGPGYFILDEETGILKGQKGMGLFWYSEKKFKNFILELDFMSEKHFTNSGIFLRVPNVLINNDYIGQCYEVQIDNASRGIHQTGAVYDALAPSSLAFNDHGEWNHYKITYHGKHIEVELNGVIIVDWDAEPKGKVTSLAKEGYIGLQNHDSRAPIYFKNIFVKEL